MLPTSFSTSLSTVQGHKIKVVFQQGRSGVRKLCFRHLGRNDNMPSKASASLLRSEVCPSIALEIRGHAMAYLFAVGRWRHIERSSSRGAKEMRLDAIHIVSVDKQCWYRTTDTTGVVQNRRREAAGGFVPPCEAEKLRIPHYSHVH